MAPQLPKCRQLITGFGGFDRSVYQLEGAGDEGSAGAGDGAGDDGRARRDGAVGLARHSGLLQVVVQAQTRAVHHPLVPGWATEFSIVHDRLVFRPWPELTSLHSYHGLIFAIKRKVFHIGLHRVSLPCAITNTKKRLNTIRVVNRIPSQPDIQ